MATSIMARLLLAASLLSTTITAYNPKVVKPLIEAVLEARDLNPSKSVVGGLTNGGPGSIPGGINFIPGTPANITSLPAQFFLDRGSKRSKLSYGPFPVQGMEEGNGMIDYFQAQATMPCTNCTLTFMQAGLEYPDGSYANANTSAWLHHVVVFQNSMVDVACGEKIYGTTGLGQRWFASGNERTPVSTYGKIKAGYRLGDGNNMMLLELMNQAMEYQEVVLTIEYEFIDGFPSDFYEILPVWLDIGGCEGVSDMPVPADSNVTFNYKSPVYTSQIQGALLGTGAHLHDGGVYADIVMNGTVQCESIATYGSTTGYWDQAGAPMSMDPDALDMQMEMGGMRMPHISEMGYCLTPSSMVAVGDNWGVNAYYNFTDYAPMMDSDGEFSDVMGIAMLYVASGMSQEEMQSFAGTATPNPYPNGVYDSDVLAPLSTLAPMQCVWQRDSPGELTTAGLNMTDPDVQMLYLMSILDDACLQVWSRAASLDFGYAIVGFMVLIALVTRGQQFNLYLRRRLANAKGSEAVWKSNGLFPRVMGVFRSIGYRQYTPTMMPNFFKVPNLGISLAILGYTGFITLLTFLHADTHDDQRWQSFGVRAAWMSMAQLPLVIALANKKNFVGAFTGVTYERLNILHRWTARGLLLTSLLHFGLQSHGWNRLGLMQLEWSSDECPPTGIAALALLLWMNLSTLAPFRNVCYELFVLQHIVTFIGFLVAIYYHLPVETAETSRNYLFAGVALYVASRLIQTLMFAYRNIRPSRAQISAASSNVTKITLANSTLKSWTPGSHILIRFPSLGAWQSHPATIASTPDSHNGDLVFFLRAHKGFSSKLHKAAIAAEPTQTKMCLIDGPYGGLQADYSSFHTVVLVASSTGITFTLPILLDLAERASRKIQLPVRRVELFWALKDVGFTQAIRSELTGAISSLRAHGIACDVNIHVTGEYSESDLSSSSETSLNSGEKEKAVAVRVTRSSSWDHDLIPITKGRFNVAGMLSRVRSEAEGEIGVAVCGSLSLSTDVRNTVAGMQGSKGMYLHVEGFGW